MEFSNKNKRYQRELYRKQLKEEDASLLNQLLLLSDTDRLILLKQAKLSVSLIQSHLKRGYKLSHRTRSLIRQFLDIPPQNAELRHRNSQLERIENASFRKETEQTTDGFLSELGYEDY